MDKEGSGRRRTGINIQRLFIVIGCLFAILFLGLISATLHYVIQLRNNAKDSSSSPSDNPMTSEQFLRSLPLPVRFPGYFRSLDEQKLAEERLLSRTFVPAPNGTVDGLVNTCSGVCYKPTDWRPVLIHTLYHACCISQVGGCTTCQCQTMTTYENAVVYTNNKTDYEIAWFSVAGCCKCINR